MDNKEVKKFICQRCGECCIDSAPTMNHDEYKRIKKSLVAQKRKVEFKKVKFEGGYAYFTKRGYDKLKMGRDLALLMGLKPCEFLDKDDEGKYKCAIYPIRPSVCKDFGIRQWECPKNPGFLKGGKWNYLFWFNLEL